MKCNQHRPGFELVSPCSFPTTITITPRAPPFFFFFFCYLTHSFEDKGVHTFPKGICPRVNVIARLEYELAYYDSAVHGFNHYTKTTPPFYNRTFISLLLLSYQTIQTTRCCPRCVFVKALDCGIVVSKFVLQSHYYVHFQTNTLGKDMNPLIVPVMGEIASLLFL